MATSNRSGLFITLEGPEGCGKSTQAQRLASYVRELGREVLLTREPGGTPISESIRGLLHDPIHAEMHAATEIFLYCAARAQLVHQILIPFIQQGGAVICDRFSDSTLAYQGYGRGMDLDTLRSFSQFAADGLTPTITFLLDVPVEIGLLRKQQSGGEWNRMDAQAVEFHQRVRQGYLELARQEPRRWVLVDATVTQEAVWEQMKAATNRFLSPPS